MTSYGDPHAGDYDDGYQNHGAGRTPAPTPSYDTYGYQNSGAHHDGGGHQDHGYQHQSGYSNEYPDPGYYAAPVTARASVPVVSGRASVPVAGGRASVPGVSGRATVRPATRDDDVEDLDRPKKVKKKKRARRQKLLIAALGVFILMVGGGMIGGSYFYDSVLEPSQLTLKNSTEVFAADNTTQLAKLGTEHRTEVAMSELKPEIQKALIAGEDKNFYEHHGVDLWGIGRAAWNNLTGGDTQGASTITQQYARRAANDMEVTYARKLREAVMARKLEDNYTKEQILGFYLNTVYFGRGAHGIGAAYEAYFGLPAEEIEKMTVAQAAVLGAVLRQPEGKGGYDPAENFDAAKGRWGYVLDNMVEMKWLAPEARAAMKYPAPADPKAPQPGELQPPRENSGGATGITDSGTGFVIRYVGEELQEKGIIDYLKKEKGLDNWKNAGLRITTTIQPKVQAALEAQLNKAVQGSSLSKQREKVIGAGVALDPRNGQVLAYYGGGNNGTGTDWAADENPHQPASSFKIYTLAAAIENGISINSHWDPTALHKPEDDYDLGNANREGDFTCKTWCTLEEMTIKSFNVPFFNIARTIGPEKIVKMAHQAGVSHMWETDPVKAHDLSKGIPDRGVFDYWVGFGQYPISVIDHATGTATIANHGVYNKPHFILRVEQKNKQTGEWERLPMGDEVLHPEQRIRPEVADEVTSVLKQIPTGRYALKGRQGAGKTGTWENGNTKDKSKEMRKYRGTNAHAWFTGYTPQIAATIWIGSSDVNDTPIVENTGKKDLFDEDNITSSYPKLLWKHFMDQAHKDMGLKPERLANGSNGRIGSAEAGDGVSPTPSPPTCGFFICPTESPGRGWPTRKPTKTTAPPDPDD